MTIAAMIEAAQIAVVESADSCAIGDAVTDGGIVISGVGVGVTVGVGELVGTVIGVEVGFIVFVGATEVGIGVGVAVIVKVSTLVLVVAPAASVIEQKQLCVLAIVQPTLI